MATAAPPSPPLTLTSPFPTKTLTIRHPPHTYLHLTLLSTSTLTALTALPPIDILTARTHLTSALQQYLGLTGTAIPIDILTVEGRNCWIRVPREDGAALMGALGQWVGGAEGGVAWRVRGKGEWLGVVAGGGGEGLFEV